MVIIVYVKYAGMLRLNPRSKYYPTLKYKVNNSITLCEKMSYKNFINVVNMIVIKNDLTKCCRNNKNKEKNNAKTFL